MSLFTLGGCIFIARAISETIQCVAGNMFLGAPYAFCLHASLDSKEREGEVSPVGIPVFSAPSRQCNSLKAKGYTITDDGVCQLLFRYRRLLLS